MRTIQVSDATYAALWSRWQEGDDGEEGVIRRLLGIETKPSGQTPGKKPFRDSRYGVEFPDGFEIFRTYKGQDYRAVVRDGEWYRPDTNRTARSLNSLSAQIGAATENAWIGWYYKDGDRVRPISDLRDPGRIRRRGERSV